VGVFTLLIKNGKLIVQNLQEWYFSSIFDRYWNDCMALQGWILILAQKLYPSLYI